MYRARSNALSRGARVDLVQPVSEELHGFRRQPHIHSLARFPPAGLTTTGQPMLSAATMASVLLVMISWPSWLRYQVPASMIRPNGWNTKFYQLSDDLLNFTPWTPLGLIERGRIFRTSVIRVFFQRHAKRGAGSFLAACVVLILLQKRFQSLNRVLFQGPFARAFGRYALPGRPFRRYHKTAPPQHQNAEDQGPLLYGTHCRHTTLTSCIS